MSNDKKVFDFEQAGNVLVVIPNGTFMEFRDNDIRNAYNDTYRLLSAPDIKHLLVDFTKLTYFGSTLVGILIQLAKKARMGGGEAVLCHLTPDMQNVMKSLMLLENTKTNFYWVSYPTREVALTTLANKDSEANDSATA